MPPAKKVVPVATEADRPPSPSAQSEDDPEPDPLPGTNSGSLANGRRVNSVPTLQVNSQRLVPPPSARSVSGPAAQSRGTGDRATRDDSNRFMRAFATGHSGSFRKAFSNNSLVARMSPRRLLEAAYDAESDASEEGEGTNDYHLLAGARDMVYGMGNGFQFVMERIEGREAGMDMLQQDLSKGGPASPPMGRRASSSPSGADDAEEHFVRLQSDMSSWDMDFTFYYKKRRCTGRAIHIAALHKSGGAIIEKILARSPEQVEAECTFNSRGGEGCACAIHLAAGKGHVQPLKRLLEGMADVNKPTKVNGQNNITALYDAVLFNRAEAVELLLMYRADANARSRNGTTPIHLAAKHGLMDVVPALLDAQVDIRAPDSEGLTPLETAILNGQFPVSDLHLLSTHTIAELLEVARLSPDAASELIKRHPIPSNELEGQPMREITATSRHGAQVDTAWTDSLNSAGLNIESWIELMDSAPSAAADLLDAVTCIPKVSDIHHPLPKQAYLKPKEDIRSYYGTEVDWKWHNNPESGQPHYPKWHDFLTRGCASAAAQAKMKHELHVGSFSSSFAPLNLQCFGVGERAKISSVQIRVVKMPGILHPTVLHTLGNTSYLPIFAKVATQGIINVSWQGLAMGSYCLTVCYSIVEMVVLILWTLPSDEVFQGATLTTTYPNYQEDVNATLGRRNSSYFANETMRPPPEDRGIESFTHKDAALAAALWSLFLVLSAMSAVYEMCEMVGYAVVLKRPLDYLSLKSAVDVITILIALKLSYDTWDDILPNDEDSELLAAIVVVRWFQFMYNFRGFVWAGEKILPILNSFLPVRGMMLITAFSFIAFYHGYVILDGDVAISSGESRERGIDVFLNAYRFLFMGDGDGINGVLAVGERDENGDGVTRFLFVLAGLIFCLCILNLFIAVHSEAYDAAKENAKTVFLQERVRICLAVFLRPSWAGPPIRYKRCVLFLIFASVVPVWVWLLNIREIHPVWPSCLLLCAVLLGNAIFNARPWMSKWSGNDDARWRRTYLWLCVRSDYSEDDWMPAQTFANEVDGRLMAMKRDSMMRYKRMGSQLKDVQDALQRQNVLILGELELLRRQVGRVQKSMKNSGNRNEPSVKTPQQSFGSGRSEELSAMRAAVTTDRNSEIDEGSPGQPEEEEVPKTCLFLPQPQPGINSIISNSSDVDGSGTGGSPQQRVRFRSGKQEEPSVKTSHQPSNGSSTSEPTRSALRTSSQNTAGGRPAVSSKAAPPGPSAAGTAAQPPATEPPSLAAPPGPASPTLPPEGTMSFDSPTKLLAAISGQMMTPDELD
mmetsp:Transcript_39821/g.89255  ORF Transcript_39821/g.89255 Transcript_39821/m.89255 type:complete len:1300 (-) Transcript_39821:130-4029(-)